MSTVSEPNPASVSLNVSTDCSGEVVATVTVDPDEEFVQRVLLEVTPDGGSMFEVEMEQDSSNENRFTTDLSMFGLTGLHNFQARLEYETNVKSAVVPRNCT